MRRIAGPAVMSALILAASVVVAAAAAVAVEIYSQYWKRVLAEGH